MGPTRPNRVSEPGLAGLEPNPGTGANRVRGTPWILLVLVSATLVVLCMTSRLTDEEARLLLSLRGDGDLPPLAIPEPLLRAWYFLVGGMERPSRLLSLMGFSGGAALVVAAALLTSPGLLMETVRIGSPWGAAWISALFLWVLMAFTRLRGTAVALWGLLAAFLVTAILCPPRWAHLVDGSAELARSFAGSPGVPAAAGALALVFLLGRGGAWKVLLVTAPTFLAAACLEPNDGLRRPQLFFTALAWPAIAVLVASGSRFNLRDGSLLALATLLALVHAGPDLLPRSDAARQAADRLDWIAASPAVSPHAWVIISGDDRHLLRWMEKTGHDTGRLSMVVDDDEDLEQIRRRSLIFKPPQIVVLAPSEALEKALQRYGPDPRIPDVPPPTQVLVFRR